MALAIYTYFIKTQRKEPIHKTRQTTNTFKNGVNYRHVPENDAQQGRKVETKNVQMFQHVRKLLPMHLAPIYDCVIECMSGHKRRFWK